MVWLDQLWGTIGGLTDNNTTTSKPNTVLKQALQYPIYLVEQWRAHILTMGLFTQNFLPALPQVMEKRDHRKINEKRLIIHHGIRL